MGGCVRSMTKKDGCGPVGWGTGYCGVGFWESLVGVVRVAARFDCLAFSIFRVDSFVLFISAIGIVFGGRLVAKGTRVCSRVPGPGK